MYNRRTKRVRPYLRGRRRKTEPPKSRALTQLCVQNSAVCVKGRRYVKRCYVNQCRHRRYVKHCRRVQLWTCCCRVPSPTRATDAVCSGTSWTSSSRNKADLACQSCMAAEHSKRTSNYRCNLTSSIVLIKVRKRI